MVARRVDRGWRDVRPGGRGWANVSKSTVGSGSALAARPARLSGLAGVSGGALQSPASLPGPGARRRGRADLRAAPADRLEPAAARRRARDRRAHSTVHRVLRRGGCSRRPRPERPAVVRYEWPCPGQLLHMDVKKLGRFERPATRSPATAPRSRRRRLGVRALDRRRLLPAGLLRDPRRRAGRDRDRLHPPRAGLLPRARHRRRAADDRQRVRLHPQPPLRELLRARAIRHIRTRPYTPRTNGKVERYQQTLQREWAYALEYASSHARRASLPHWVRHYNERRTHSALGNRPPHHRVREVTGLNS